MANFVSSITLAFKDAFSSGFANAKKSFAGMEAALGKINENQSMNNLAAGLAMATSMTEPFRRALSSALDEPSRLAGTFGSSMRNIQSLTNDTNSSLAGLSKELLAIGGKAVAGPHAVADAYYNIASGIGRAEVRMDTLRAAVALAESGQANLGAATSGLISVVNAYGTPAENMTDLSDVFFQTVRKGVGSLDGFVSAMSSVSGLSASIGIGFDELGSSMAFLTAKGQTEAVAATQLKAAMVSLMRPNEELKKALQSIGISSGSAMVEEYGLAQSMIMVKAAVGGSQDKMAKALGSVEALQAAIALTDTGYRDFARTYAEGLSGATAAALEAQAQSYESKVARLNAATDSLKISIGGNINAIKGLFVDMGASFLSGPVSAIMNSPIGGVFRGIAAGAGLAAQGVLSLGSGALNTATQLVLLTATLKNSKGFAGLFGSSLSLLTQPFKKIGASALKAIPKIGAFGASLWTALLPVLPIVLGVTAAVAAIAGAAYLVHKHFDKIRAFLAGVSDWVLVAVAAINPLIGIPALIIKHWDTVKAFFVGLWGQVTEVFTAVWTGIVNFFVSLWNGVPGFFSSLWNGITAVVASVANWFGGVWGQVAGAFAGVWTWVKDLFVSIWENIKGVVLGFVEWLSPVIDAIIAPFRAIGNVIGGIAGAVKGWMGETVDKGNTKLAEMSAAKAAAKPAEAASPAKPADMGAIAAPSFGAIAAPAMTTTMAGVGGNALLAEHLAAASRKGIAASDISYAASDAFMGAGTRTESGDLADFSEAARPARNMVADLPWNKPEARTEKPAPRTIKIENLYLQADDAMSLLNFVRQLECAVLEPVGVAV